MCLTEFKGAKGAYVGLLECAVAAQEGELSSQVRKEDSKCVGQTPPPGDRETSAKKARRGQATLQG